MDLNEVKKFEQIIGYTFKDKSILKTALTHSSYANENKSHGIQSNERLEFLGDSILNLIVSKYIFLNYKQLSEGELTKIRAGVVCEASLKEISDRMEIGTYILLGKGEELTGGRSRTSILSDAFEAIVGAIFLDGGFKLAENFILNQLGTVIHVAAKMPGMVDYKTRLQESLQRKGDVKITYDIVDQTGPDHSKSFSVQVKCDGSILGTGKGKSKKEAEQNAARNALGME